MINCTYITVEHGNLNRIKACRLFRFAYFSVQVISGLQFGQLWSLSQTFFVKLYVTKQLLLVYVECMDCLHNTNQISRPTIVK